MSTNIWRIPISVSERRVAGAPQRLTFGTGIEQGLSVSDDGRMAFASLGSNHDIWSIGVDDSGRLVGEMNQLTEDEARNSEPSASADGSKLVYTSTRAGNPDLWLMDVESGEQTNLTNSPQQERDGRMFPDGSKVAYHVGQAMYVVDTEGGLPKQVCDDCGFPYDWTLDGKKILFFYSLERGDFPIYALVDIETGERTDVLRHDERHFFRPRFSPDGRWIAFTAALRGDTAMFVAPFQEGVVSDESEWIRVSDPKSNFNFHCFWARDGNTLYFASPVGGYFSIWGRHLDPNTKQPLGDAFLATAFAGGSVTGVGACR